MSHAGVYFSLFSSVGGETGRISESVRRFGRRYRGSVRDQPTEANARKRAMQVVRELRDLADEVERVVKSTRQESNPRDSD